VSGSAVCSTHEEAAVSALAVIAWMGIMLMPGEAGSTAIQCMCAEAKQVNGWCERHAVGYVASLPIHSRLLHETIDAHGHQLDNSTFVCPVCRKAIENDGYCGEHNLGFVKGLAFFSRLTYELARGERLEPMTLKCATCRKNAATSGWCPTDGVGMVGSVAIRDRMAWQVAARKMETLLAADQEAKRCEQCAVAMVTDGQCPFCRIDYKDGVRVKPAAVP